MKPKYDFSYSKLKQTFSRAKELGYKIMPCREFISEKEKGISGKLLINRVDVDWSCKKAKLIAEIFDELQIKATFFIRLHGDEYNPFSFENYRCLKYILEGGHEIGYHSEVIDQSQIWEENAVDCLNRDLSILGSMLNTKIVGVASHGGLTGFNNLDFWQKHKPSDFGLLYEGYDREKEFNLFYESLYVSESNCQWKCYKNGERQNGDDRSLLQHCEEGEPVIYSTLHPETFYNQHIYE